MSDLPTPPGQGEPRVDGGCSLSLNNADFSGDKTLSPGCEVTGGPTSREHRLSSSLSTSSAQSVALAFPLPSSFCAGEGEDGIQIKLDGSVGMHAQPRFSSDASWSEDPGHSVVSGSRCESFHARSTDQECAAGVAARTDRLAVNKFAAADILAEETFVSVKLPSPPTSTCLQQFSRGVSYSCRDERGLLLRSEKMHGDEAQTQPNDDSPAHMPKASPQDREVREKKGKALFGDGSSDEKASHAKAAGGCPTAEDPKVREAWLVREETRFLQRGGSVRHHLERRGTESITVASGVCKEAEKKSTEVFGSSVPRREPHGALVLQTHPEAGKEQCAKQRMLTDLERTLERRQERTRRGDGDGEDAVSSVFFSASILQTEAGCATDGFPVCGQRVSVGTILDDDETVSLAYPRPSVSEEDTRKEDGIGANTKSTEGRRELLLEEKDRTLGRLPGDLRSSETSELYLHPAQEVPGLRGSASPSWLAGWKGGCEVEAIPSATQRNGEGGNVEESRCMRATTGGTADLETPHISVVFGATEECAGREEEAETTKQRRTTSGQENEGIVHCAGVSETECSCSGDAGLNASVRRGGRKPPSGKAVSPVSCWETGDSSAGRMSRHLAFSAALSPTQGAAGSVQLASSEETVACKDFSLRGCFSLKGCDGREVEGYEEGNCSHAVCDGRGQTSCADILRTAAAPPGSPVGAARELNPAVGSAEICPRFLSGARELGNAQDAGGETTQGEEREADTGGDRETQGGELREETRDKWYTPLTRVMPRDALQCMQREGETHRLPSDGRKQHNRAPGETRSEETLPGSHSVTQRDRIRLHSERRRPFCTEELPSDSRLEGEKRQRLSGFGVSATLAAKEETTNQTTEKHQKEGKADKEEGQTGKNEQSELDGSSAFSLLTARSSFNPALRFAELLTPSKRQISASVCLLPDAERKHSNPSRSPEEDSPLFVPAVPSPPPAASPTPCLRRAVYGETLALPPCLPTSAARGKRVRTLSPPNWELPEGLVAQRTAYAEVDALTQTARETETESQREAEIQRATGTESQCEQETQTERGMETETEIQREAEIEAEIETERETELDAEMQGRLESGSHASEGIGSVTSLESFTHISLSVASTEASPSKSNSLSGSSVADSPSPSLPLPSSSSSAFASVVSSTSCWLSSSSESSSFFSSSSSSSSSPSTVPGRSVPAAAVPSASPKAFRASGSSSFAPRLVSKCAASLDPASGAADAFLPREPASPQPVLSQNDGERAVNSNKKRERNTRSDHRAPSHVTCGGDSSKEMSEQAAKETAGLKDGRKGISGTEEGKEEGDGEVTAVRGVCDVKSLGATCASSSDSQAPRIPPNAFTAEEVKGAPQAVCVSSDSGLLFSSSSPPTSVSSRLSVLLSTSSGLTGGRTPRDADAVSEGVSGGSAEERDAASSLPKRVSSSPLRQRPSALDGGLQTRGSSSLSPLDIRDLHSVEKVGNVRVGDRIEVCWSIASGDEEGGVELIKHESRNGAADTASACRGTQCGDNLSSTTLREADEGERRAFSLASDLGLRRTEQAHTRQATASSLSSGGGARAGRTSEDEETRGGEKIVWWPAKVEMLPGQRRVGQESGRRVMLLRYSSFENFPGESAQVIFIGPNRLLHLGSPEASCQESNGTERIAEEAESYGRTLEAVGAPRRRETEHQGNRRAATCSEARAPVLIFKRPGEMPPEDYDSESDASVSIAEILQEQAHLDQEQGTAEMPSALHALYAQFASLPLLTQMNVAASYRHFADQFLTWLGDIVRTRGQGCTLSKEDIERFAATLQREERSSCLPSPWHR
uniref:Uncharacterized protein n=1 Tax=Toxoplasma gondii COUG TaxID=1074873 RepID=A0A2G8Y1J7_TOXGO|nr:hypothetical protein TGCOUG_270230 [Toxoplasma gondii COUG]